MYENEDLLLPEDGLSIIISLLPHSRGLFL